VDPLPNGGREDLRDNLRDDLEGQPLLVLVRRGRVELEQSEQLRLLVDQPADPEKRRTDPMLALECRERVCDRSPLGLDAHQR